MKLRGANNEGVLAALLLLLIVVLSIASKDFFSLSTFFSILRDSIVPLILAIGVLLVMITGGIDVSFLALSAFATYTTMVLLGDGRPDAGVVTVLCIAMLIGAGLGLVNGLVIATFRLPTLIVTLGTQGIFKGVLVAYIGSKYLADIPTSLGNLGNTDLLTIQTADGAARLPVFIVPVIVLCLVVSWVLRRTMFGRTLYAIGGDEEAARRAGLPVMRTRIVLYVVVGVLAAVAGVMLVGLSGNSIPNPMADQELDIIAAVVLGGASIFGGRGSVLGTVLGVLLIKVISNSLILVGIPSVWQRAAIGLLLLLGVGAQALSAKRAARHVSTITDAQEVAK